MSRKTNILFQIDWFIILLYIALILIGWISIYAAVYDEKAPDIFSFTHRYGKQFVWIIAAIVLAIMVSLIESRFYLFFAWPVYFISLFLLALVLIAGKEVNSSRSWFEIAGVSLQPAEFAKLATSLALARFLSASNVILTRTKPILKTAVILLLPVSLILLQPDMGSAVVFASFFFVLFRSGMSSWLFFSSIFFLILFFAALLLDDFYISVALTSLALIIAGIVSRRIKVMLIPAAVIAGIYATAMVLNIFSEREISGEVLFYISLLPAGALFVWYNYKYRIRSLLPIFLFLIGSILLVYAVDYSFNNLLKPHQQSRISIVLGGDTDNLGAGYNVNQSLISIGSGGLTGKGFLQGTQTKFRFVPEQSTDFIFCTIGEEWGFIGSATVIALYLALLFRIQYLAERQRSAFSRIYGYSVFSVLFIHFFINIGMTIGLVPVIGIPLPFISYGGSSLWTFTIMLFIFLKLDASRKEYLL